LLLFRRLSQNDDPVNFVANSDGFSLHVVGADRVSNNNERPRDYFTIVGDIVFGEDGIQGGCMCVEVEGGVPAIVHRNWRKQ
jgi:hypothetical protein